MKPNAPATEVDSSGPWLSPILLPENPMKHHWGVLWDGKGEPLNLESLLALVRQGRSDERRNGKTKRKAVEFVAVPGVNRIVPLAEGADC